MIDEGSEVMSSENGLIQVPPEEARDMVLSEIRKGEDKARMQRAVQQVQQGQWTTWEDATQRSLTWNEMWHMAPLKLSFIIRATYDLLPTKANLAKWYQENEKCPLCGACKTLKHILNGCKFTLSAGRYTWRHNRVLSTMIEVLQRGVETSNEGKSRDKKCYFLKEGAMTASKIESNVKRRDGLVGGTDDWMISADLSNYRSYPPEIRVTNQRPDIVIHSNKLRKFVLIELTVPYETNIEEQHEYKLAKYEELVHQLSEKGNAVKLFAVEVGSRGFIANSMYSLLRQLNLKPKELNTAVSNIRTITENASCWIWQKRNDQEKRQDL